MFFMSTLWSFSSGCHRPPLWGGKGSNVALSTLTQTFSSCLFSLEPRPGVLDPSLDDFATCSQCSIENMRVQYCNDNDIMQAVGCLLHLWRLWLQQLILCSVFKMSLFPVFQIFQAVSVSKSKILIASWGSKGHKVSSEGSKRINRFEKFWEAIIWIHLDSSGTCLVPWWAMMSHDAISLFSNPWRMPG